MLRRSFREFQRRPSVNRRQPESRIATEFAEHARVVRFCYVHVGVIGQSGAIREKRRVLWGRIEREYPRKQCGERPRSVREAAQA